MYEWLIIAFCSSLMITGLWRHSNFKLKPKIGFQNRDLGCGEGLRTTHLIWILNSVLSPEIFKKSLRNMLLKGLLIRY